MSNGSITVRLAEKDIQEIDRLVAQGQYTSRSDMIRSSVRRTLVTVSKEEILEIVDRMGKIADEKGITMDDIVKDVRRVRRELYKEIYGDD